jgi:hypothetical protein
VAVTIATRDSTDRLPALSGLRAGAYTPHRLHEVGRTWSETNCYVDLWVETLHALDLDPVPVLACALSADFDGDQWTFLKPAPEDLRAVYGIEVAELNVWRPLVEHIADHLARGRLLTVEVDSFWLPDTAGTTYHQGHAKTTVAVAALEPDRLGYFHGPGYFEVGGDDLLGLLAAAGRGLPPYVEVVRLEGLRRDPARVSAATAASVGEHLRRRPADNPVARLGERVLQDLPWLAAADEDAFHAYAFATCRAVGATADLAAEVSDLLDSDASTEAAGHFRAASTAAKSLQFQLARAARGRTVDVRGTLAALAEEWGAAVALLAGRHAAR